MSDAAASFYDQYWTFRESRGDTTAANRVKLRHEQALEFLAARMDLRDARVLDMGCGDGIMGQLLGSRGCRVTGIDVSQQALKIAAPHYADVRQLDLDTDDTPPLWLGYYDALVCLEVLEHIVHPQRNIGRAFELCRPGGLAVFSFPNIFSWKNRLMFVRGRWPHGYCTYDPREHLQVFELPQFRRWVAEAGFRLHGIAITPDLPSFKPLRRAMFAMRGALARCGPSLWAMQINVFAEKPR